MLDSTDVAPTPVTVIRGDGIGPEVVDAAMRVVEAAGAGIVWEEREAGKAAFERGLQSGVPEDTIESIRRTGVALKGPLETPVGYGQKSANVTLRKLFETYGNIRPVHEVPGTRTPYSGRGIDLVIVRENVEDLYAGIEHMQTPGVAQGLKIISRKGCEKVCRLAFELARAEGRSKVHCATKANIMKQTEGLFKRTFEDVAREYPDIEAHHIIVDNCAHMLVRHPELFDVIVTSNMNGDILSDLTSGLAGGLGIAPSANIGSNVAIFEAVHGSAPDIAGQDIANPTALMMSAVMMLRHIGEFAAADRMEHALFVALEEGNLTADLLPASGLGTRAFTDAVIGSMGRESTLRKPREYRPVRLPQVSVEPVLVRPQERRVVGVDVFVEADAAPGAVGRVLEEAALGSRFALKMVSNRGMMVYPSAVAQPDCVDVWRARFVARDKNREPSEQEILDLLARVSHRYRWMHVEKLQEFDGERGYSLAQGEE